MKHIKEELPEPINLISEVTNILTELNHPNPTLWQHTGNIIMPQRLRKY